MLNRLFHPCLCSTCSRHPCSTCTHLFVALILIVKAEISGPGSFPIRTCFSSVARTLELYFRLNSCRLKWSLPPTASSHRLPPFWVSVLLLLLCCLPTLKVGPASADSPEGPIGVSSVTLDTTKAAHFLARMVLLALMNWRKAQSRGLWLWVPLFHFSVWTPAPRNTYIQYGWNCLACTDGKSD